MGARAETLRLLGKALSGLELLRPHPGLPKRLSVLQKTARGRLRGRVAALLPLVTTLTWRR
ncbi:hypothetical protein ADL03_35060 [Nocardia sp. NRRL S-836]|nr:hypothetical protein ADL03_35060 [Nocardia sp. NRRL S-836]